MLYMKGKIQYSCGKHIIPRLILLLFFFVFARHYEIVQEGKVTKHDVENRKYTKQNWEHIWEKGPIGN